MVQKNVLTAESSHVADFSQHLVYGIRTKVIPNNNPIIINCSIKILLKLVIACMLPDVWKMEGFVSTDTHQPHHCLGVRLLEEEKPTRLLLLHNDRIRDLLENRSLPDTRISGDQNKLRQADAVGLFVQFRP